MGALADALVAYAQPLLDQTDGSQEQMSKAFAISQLCYNLALVSEDQRDATLAEMRGTLAMSEKEFDEFRRSVVVPMIRRHEQMFPLMHRKTSPLMHRKGPIDSVTSPSSPRAHTRAGAGGEKYPGTAPYAPCPCNSGKKYKFCCGAKRR